VVVEHGVTVIGFMDLPSRLAPTASQLYGTNLCHLLSDMGGDKSWHVDLEDEVVRGALVLLDGKLMWPPPKREIVAPPALAKPQAAPSPPTPKRRSPAASAALVLLGAVLVVALGQVAPVAFLTHLTVFVLACFIGYQVVWNVTPALHTPLMSVTNAISGIILIGGMLQVSGPPASLATILAAVAVLLAMINVAGGFLVTQRMLAMFRR
jgi:NAD(P) transhydrogenase subunit alpha